MAPVCYIRAWGKLICEDKKYLELKISSQTFTKLNHLYCSICRALKKCRTVSVNLIHFLKTGKTVVKIFRKDYVCWYYILNILHSQDLLLLRWSKCMSFSEIKLYICICAKTNFTQSMNFSIVQDYTYTRTVSLKTTYSYFNVKCLY